MKRENQRERVLKYMRKFGFITTRDAGIELDIWDLQSNIRDLKNEGIIIYSDWITNKNTKSTYKVYSLSNKGIKDYKRRYSYLGG